MLHGQLHDIVYTVMTSTGIEKHNIIVTQAMFSTQILTSTARTKKTLIQNRILSTHSTRQFAIRGSSEGELYIASVHVYIQTSCDRNYYSYAYIKKYSGTTQNIDAKRGREQK